MARDSSGVGVSDGTPIFFSTNNGLMIPGVDYTVDGAASAVLRASSVPGPSWVVVNAGFGVRDSVLIDLTPGRPAIITVTPQFPSISADGVIYRE